MFFVESNRHNKFVKSFPTFVLSKIAEIISLTSFFQCFGCDIDSGGLDVLALQFYTLRKHGQGKFRLFLQRLLLNITEMTSRTNSSNVFLLKYTFLKQTSLSDENIGGGPT